MDEGVPTNGFALPGCYSWIQYILVSRRTTPHDRMASRDQAGTSRPAERACDGLPSPSSALCSCPLSGQACYPEASSTASSRLLLPQAGHRDQRRPGEGQLRLGRPGIIITSRAIAPPCPEDGTGLRGQAAELALGPVIYASMMPVRILMNRRFPLPIAPSTSRDALATLHRLRKGGVAQSAFPLPLE